MAHCNTITPPPSVSLAHSLLSSSSCLRRCSSASLLFLSFSISPSIFFSLSRSSSSCFFFCMEVRSCSERFTSPRYSVSISFQAMVSVAWSESRGGRDDVRRSGNTDQRKNKIHGVKGTAGRAQGWSCRQIWTSLEKRSSFYCSSFPTP